MAQNAKVRRTYIPIANQVTVANLKMVSQDIAKWKQAIDSARNTFNPKRKLLYELYESIMLDGHLISVTGKRIKRITNKKIHFTIKDKKGQVDETVRDYILETPWFYNMIKHYMEAKIWGHSLIELIPEPDVIIGKAVLVPRFNVIPEKEFVAWDYNNDSEGFNYKLDGQYSKFLIEAGEPKDYGLLMSAAQYVIYKRGGFGDWAQFAELFGMPFREGKYNPYDPDSRKAVEEALRDSGGSGYIVLPEGASLQFHDNNGTGKSEVFENLVDKCDEQMSKLMLGQTMTTDSGSSRSQSEVHQDTEDEITLADMIELEHWLNWEVNDKLLQLGFKVPEGRYRFPQLENLPLEKRIIVDREVAKKVEIPPEYWYDTYGLPTPEGGAKAIQYNPLPGTETEEDPEPTDPPKGKGKKAAPMKEPKGKKIEASAGIEVNCCTHDYRGARFSAEAELTPDELKLIEMMHKGQAGTYDPATMQMNINMLSRGLQTGLPLTTDYNTPDHVAATMMEANINRFGFDKNLATVLELNRALKMDEGFEDFKKKAGDILGTFNHNYLRTEYDFAIATAQNASAWLRQKRQAEVFPFLQYQTVGDSQVRPAHAALDGKVFRLDDPSWQDIYPPNGFGCRCEMIQLMDHQVNAQDIADGPQAKGLLGDEYDKMKKGGFAVNRGELNQVFDLNKAYAKELEGNTVDPNELTWKDAGLKTYADMKKPRTPMPKHEMSKDEIAAAVKLLKDQRKATGLPLRHTDYSGRQIAVYSKDVSKHTRGDYLSDTEERHRIYANIPEALSQPDEVYFQYWNKKRFQYTYVKFYNDEAFVVVAGFQGIDKGDTGRLFGLYIKTWYKMTGDNARKGVLIKRKG